MTAADATFPTDPTSAREGAKLDDYRIEGLFVRTGTSSILRGTDLRTGSPVAIKIPHPEIEGDVTFYSRFQREQAIGQKLNHPGVAKVIADRDHSRVYMVMEWAEGTHLRQILHEQGKLSPERAVRIALGVCNALEYVHSQGVVHRDLKPENIIVDADDRTKMIDFGIAGQAGARRLTFGKFTQVMGTPDYISPEQVKGKRGDARSDIYALGIMLYEMLTGEVPFTGDDPFAIMNKRLSSVPVPLRKIDPGISPQLQQVVQRCLERDPCDRYANARELAHDLAHQDEVNIDEKPRRRESESGSAPWTPGPVTYALLALIPALIFMLLLWARHRS